MSVAAPIRHIAVESQGTTPPEYNVFILSAQTTDCEAFEGVGSIQRDGKIVRIEVTNARLVDPDRPCQEVLQEQLSLVSIGSDFKPGETYTVMVNNFPKDFTVPGGIEVLSESTPAPPTVEPLDTPVPIGPVLVERVSLFLDELDVS